MRLHQGARLACFGAVVALIGAACTGGTGPAEQLPTGEIAVQPARYLDADEGFLVEGRQGLIVYTRDSDTICRHDLERETELCLTDDRFDEVGFVPQLAAESTLVLQLTDGLDVSGDGGLVADFDSQTVRELAAGLGGPAAVSPNGERLLSVNYPAATATVSRLDGSSPSSVFDPEWVSGGRWADDDHVWLSAASEIAVYDAPAGEAVSSFEPDDGAALMVQEVFPTLGLGLAWNFSSVSTLDFGPGAIRLVDIADGSSLPVELPLDGFPLGFGVAPDGSYLVLIWERDDPLTLELFVAPVDHEAGTVGPIEPVHTFDLSEPDEAAVGDMSLFSMKRIVVDDADRLTWFTNSAVMTVDLGR